ncbi:Receptor-like protein kinase [Canna indica]|uniref:Receptor-like protein kinase n=1 Tax=Canna indica TaxID=4628 RepID=A0AAQ3JKG8_9LILI|nr:Receptor-like protein kinase [Canna indica]
MAVLFFLVLVLAYFIATIDAQRQLPSTQGFISIDCGSNTTNYTDEVTNLVYVSDDQFTDAGINFRIQASNYSKQLQTLRSFPSASRSCYVLKPVTQNNKYLVRATFFYGNYDNKNSDNIMFDLHIDVNFWRKVNLTAPGWYRHYEAIVVALGDSLSVCLVDVGSGTPFISVLELRPLDAAMYPAANTSQYLVNNFRVNVGGPTEIRYPDDPYDRIWWPWNRDVWNTISTTDEITIDQNSFFKPPTAVMQTAATPINSSVMDFSWVSTFYGASLANEEYINFFFSEIVANTSRAFNIYVNGDVWYRNYTPLNFTASTIYSTKPVKQRSTDISEGPEKVNSSNIGHQDNPLQLENRQFTYMELDKITYNFKRVLGHGGFGTVYHGYLEDDTQVAVKMRSQSSSQGTKEFLAEVQHLLRIHHKKLVSMVGYCMERECMALVYEYMSQGTLQDHLRGKTKIGPLSWGQRLQIAIEAAEGLEYLHKACKPPLIHRDVKTSNILLNEKLEAKIADFGLSRAFHNDVYSHVSTAVVGTLGYVDPEYYSTYQISEKSDVYSFGVVLLELITAKPPIRADTENPHIVHWVRQKLAEGNMEDVVDAKLQREFDVNSIRHVVIST